MTISSPCSLRRIIVKLILKGFPCAQRKGNTGQILHDTTSKAAAVPLRLICWVCKGLVTATPTQQTEIYLLEGCNTSQNEVYVSNLKEFAIFVSQLPFTRTTESGGSCVAVFILRNTRITWKCCRIEITKEGKKLARKINERS
jgi:hypothetical protein